MSNYFGFPLYLHQGFSVNSFLVFLIFLASSCSRISSESGRNSSGEETLVAESPLLKLVSAEESGIDFQNTIQESFENNITTNINIYNGGGVAVADVNNDELPDIYFVSSTGKNKLFLNQGNLKFKDITDGSGLEGEQGFETAVTAVDINADGFLDFYVCRAGPIEDEHRRNKLYINNGDLTFTEQGKAYGIDDFSASTGANFFDFDLDGDLDLYLLNYPTDFSFCSKIEVKPSADGTHSVPNLDPKGPYDSDRFYRNDGGKFTDISKEAGILNFAYGLSVSVTDFNQDGWPDVYVGNDFIQPDFLYINNKDGSFSNQLGQFFRHTTQHTMGTEIADFDNDGLPDLHAVDMLATNQFRQKTTQNANSQSKYTSLIRNGYFEPVVRNVLQRNNGNGSFSDIGCMAGIYKTDWSWSGLLADFDNDGWKDLAITNGYRREVSDLDFIEFTFPLIRDKNIPIREQFADVYDFLNIIPTYKLRNFVYRNNGDWTFEDKTGDWFTSKASWSNGAAWADLDNDGDIDYIVSNLEDPAFIYQNMASDQSTGNYLQFNLEGSAQNPKGIGASVTIHYENQLQYLEMNPTRGIFSSVEHLLHFGLGKTSQVDKIVVRWPNGLAQTITNVKANQRLTLRFEDANEPAPAAIASESALFQDRSSGIGMNFRHIENPYNDFENHFLQPWKLSELGPMMAVADVNGDGLDDVFTGNAFDQPAMLSLQTKDGRFTPASVETWEKSKLYEDHGALFFDADRDGDQDLFVVSGGAEGADERAWQHRLYINDGKGNFEMVNAIPPTRFPGSQAAAYDYDGDGDLDIFVGSRVVLGNYPATPKSYVLRNEGTHFVDVTDEVAPEFGNVGMVAALAWVNIDQNPEAELIVTGEWMPLTAFKIVNGKLQKMDPGPLGFEKSNGLWNQLVAADVDGDGDMDLVTGNIGTNTRFTASADKPLLCYGNDFDNNGSVDPVMAYYEGENIYPLVRKDVMIKQMPFLKKKFIYAKDYAKATVSDIFGEKEINSGMVMQANMLETCWWENKGGRFERHVLPNQAQVAPVFGILVHDFNSDGHPDLLLAGNKYGMEVETGRCDASNGTLLLGDGKGGFNWVNNTLSGFWATKEARDLALLKGAAGRESVIVSNNNSTSQVYSIKKVNQ